MYDDNVYGLSRVRVEQYRDFLLTGKAARSSRILSLLTPSAEHSPTREIYYRVLAIDGNNNQSPMSNILVAETPQICAIAPRRDRPVHHSR